MCFFADCDGGKVITYNGFTPSVSKKVLDAIELATLTEFVKESPDNLYWQGRLEAKRQQMEIAADAEWLGESPSDPRTEQQIDLDLWQAETALTRESDRPY